LVAPLIEIVATGSALPGGPLDAIIATSAQAVALLAEPQVHRLKDLPLFTVGARTAAAARATQFADVRTSAQDASQLAHMIAAAYTAPARFLYLAGRNRKPDLETVLEGAGHKIEVLEIYAALAAASLPQTACEALARGELDAILHYSRRSATIFRHEAETAGFGDAAKKLLHVCISADAAAPLQGWVRQLAIADEPNESALLAALP
jgi:uroporphyrinogen-III synthase